jgi:hypothetical protein
MSLSPPLLSFLTAQQIFPLLLQFATNPTPRFFSPSPLPPHFISPFLSLRIRICAFHCIQSIISSSIAAAASAGEDEEGEDSETPNFFEEFGPPYLTAAMTSLKVLFPFSSLFLLSHLA